MSVIEAADRQEQANTATLVLDQPAVTSPRITASRASALAGAATPAPEASMVVADAVADPEPDADDNVRLEWIVVSEEGRRPTLAARWRGRSGRRPA